MSGYVKIHRRLLGHVAFRNDAEALAFAWMIAKAAWAPTCVRYKERKITLRRGQLAISVRDFARVMDRDKAWVERLLRRLKSETMVETVSETGITVITICNYSQYQATQGSLDAECETLDETGTRQGRDTEQEREEREEGKKDSNPLPPFAAPQPEWKHFAEYRKRAGKPMTQHAVKLNLAKLERLAVEGHDPREVINQSIANGWTGLFAIKEDRRNGTSGTTDHPWGRTGAAMASLQSDLDRAGCGGAAPDAANGHSAAIGGKGAGGQLALPGTARLDAQGAGDGTSAGRANRIQ